MEHPCQAGDSLPLTTTATNAATSITQAISFVRVADQIHCMTLSADMIGCLSQYTRYGFLPVVGVADTHVVEKIRALDAALQQASKQAKLPTVDLTIPPIPSAPVTDDLLNDLQAAVSLWITQIRTVTVLPQNSPLVIQASPQEEPNPDAVSHELAFWNQLAVELQHIQEQLQSSEIQNVLNLLREAKRFVAILALENNTGLEQAVSYTQDMNHFLKGYPIENIQAATDWGQMTTAVQAIFDHFNKIRSSRYYSLQRGITLLEGTTVVLRDALLRHLQDKHKNFLFMDYQSYQTKVRYPILDVLVQFQDRWEEWKEFLLEQGRRRKITGLNKMLESMTLYHLPLRERLDQLDEFRQTQETLRNTVHTVLREEEPAALQQVEQAPRQIFSALNVLDLSSGGRQALEVALEEYDLQMDAMEERLARLLREKLQACQDAEDMFGVFARFNLLLTRTRVRAAVKEFQMQLITTVQQAISVLQGKFTEKYEASAAARLSRLRGIPPVAGKILWAKQMERQVTTLMERMAAVLGPQWGQQLEGRQLRKSGDELLAKLDARAYFRSWVTEWEKELTNAQTTKLNSYPIIIQVEANGKLCPVVNFDEKSELLLKEIRHLKWLGFGKDIPRTLMMLSEEASQRYPYATAIKTALRSYQAVRVLVTAELEPLVMPQLTEIRELIAEAFDVKLSNSAVPSKKRRVRWDTKELTDWVSRLTDAVTKFEDRVEQLLRACDKVDIALNLIEQVDYKHVMFKGVLGSIQKTIDEMSLSGYSNLDSWVQCVSDKMSLVLSKRLESALESWIKALQGKEKLDTKQVSLEIVLRNQEIMPAPAMPKVRANLLDALHVYIGVVCDLPKPQGGRYEVFDSITAKSSGDMTAAEPQTFDHLVSMIPAALLADAYKEIDRHVQESSHFVDQWLAYQTLWDTQVADVAATVGRDVNQWQALLLEASEARSTLDSSATESSFGPVVVRYGKVQSQINLKYDSWQKELQASFAAILSQCIFSCRETIEIAKTKLEETTLDSASTDGIVIGVTFIQEVKQKVSIWAKELESLSSSEKLLKKQRFVFHSEWTETSVVKGLHDSLLQILERRTRTMEQQIPVLQARVMAEDKSAAKQSAELLSNWETDKPLRGTLSPPKAIEILLKFELNLKKAHVHHENLIRAKDALGLDHTVESNEILEAINELSDLKEVWEAMLAPYETLEHLKDTLWSAAVMRKIRRGLDDLLASMRSFPNRIRQYDAYTQIHDLIKSYIDGHNLVSDLKTEALKERHWKTILQRLGIRIPFSDITVGSLWDAGVISKKKEMSEILSVAQGEMALEVFINQVSDRWTKQELDLVLFQNRTRLIRGWDDLFATLDDHISGLALMKSSPFYRAVREFQEQGKLWEERLTKLRAAFDAWVDVQRRWVYLEGILFGSSDIKAQLPAEWSRFKSVDSEFIALMRRIASKPSAMEVLNIDNLQRTLERLAGAMNVIQRALGEYLAKQRNEFSRFYFLGDDDLLEIMGNSGEPGKVLAHVGKMFAGISGARFTTEGLPDGIRTRLDAMVSKDGEVVAFYEPIDISDSTNVKDWLKSLESKMQHTLALLLEQAVNEDDFSVHTILDTEEAATAFTKWALKFPAQVMILAAQINWSMGVDDALGLAESQSALQEVLRVLNWKLEVMANTVLKELPPDSRKKFEQMITELVRQRDTVRSLMDDKVSNPNDFRWLYHLRYNYYPKNENITEKLVVKLSNASFYYGFEYLGIGERLVQTPLTDKCFFTLTQALHFRMGGSPFGPAGTGKTESVKALGAALGRFVLVFNCDETFDFSAMGRLLAGLSQVGAWGCFDEFNRLEERILSAVSQQILTIQRGLLDRQPSIELLGRPINLHENVGIFITMNPGYEGRSNLPDNLKSLFRSFAMVVPDRNLIAQVMLYSQGIVTAENLAGSIVELFLLCEARMSKQRHYDFGLRALKTLLVSAGALKRQALDGKVLSGDSLASAEKNALIVGACNNVLPKLVAEDMPIFSGILTEVFPGAKVATMEDERARKFIVEACNELHLVSAEAFVQKVLQLKQVLEMRHGVMVVGKSGKSSALKVLLSVMEKLDGVKGDMYVIDPKAMSKDRLYGSLDGTTLEWTDGVVTSLLRKIIDNQKGESERRHWIVFDGDVDVSIRANL